jgi:16S rRNA (guanine1207-N2)-methyltransferase
MQKLEVPQGKYILSRYPERKKENLRAWDAADELVLQHIHEQDWLETEQRLLIINDSFGALSVALSAYAPDMLSDSYLAMQGTRNNLKANAIADGKVTLISSMDSLNGTYDRVLIKIPKSLAQLEAQLHQIRPHLHAGSSIIGAAMVKAIHTSTLKLFERITGPTHTSLARKKARLIFCQFDPDLVVGKNPYPGEYILENSDYRICNHAGVFSQQSLDIGSRFFLEHIPSSTQPGKIIDLGCGNGVIGLIAAERNPEAELLFVDESYMAVASAEATFRSAFGDSRKATFQVADGLEGIADDSIDLILNNPPFHQHNAVGDAVASQMFASAKKVLKQGGALWVVGNRHLDYHTKLKRLFGNYINVASNRKFVILKAIKR